MITARRKLGMKVVGSHAFMDRFLPLPQIVHSKRGNREAIPIPVKQP